MPDNSFDIASKIELPEVSNAIQQALKEILQRYDLKDSKSQIELSEKDKKVTLSSQDDFKLKAITEILESKLVKRYGKYLQMTDIDFAYGQKEIIEALAQKKALSYRFKKV